MHVGTTECPSAELSHGVLGRHGESTGDVGNFHRIKWLKSVLSTSNHCLPRCAMIDGVRASCKKVRRLNRNVVSVRKFSNNCAKLHWFTNGWRWETYIGSSVVKINYEGVKTDYNKNNMISLEVMKKC